MNDQFFSRNVKISLGNARTLQKEACIEGPCVSIACLWKVQPGPFKEGLEVMDKLALTEVNVLRPGNLPSS